MTGKKHNARNPDSTYLWTIKSDDVSDEGTFDFGGVSQAIVGVELRPPPPDDKRMIPVIAQRNAIEVFEYCPSCGVDVPSARPLFACGSYMVFPCSHCEWVWCEGATTLERLDERANGMET
tara:strand:+ start:2160 stop:2522 length:363 start_codon:yes stop_codon:yes gene_type:complete